MAGFQVTLRGRIWVTAEGRDGWITFFYTDARHLIVSVRFRKPYSKDIVYFKPSKTTAGLFGHGLFDPSPGEHREPLDDFLIVTEGEFNHLQLQSLSLRYGELIGDAKRYIFSCSVGGVHNADHEVIRQVSLSPIFCYDNDPEDAGFALVSKAQENMGVTAFTTPRTPSDLDEFIRSFRDDYTTAWKALKSLVAKRKSYPRIYSCTGTEFFRGEVFIPKLLGDAIMQDRNFRYVGSVLWVYTNGVYRPNGEPQIKSEALRLLGEECRQNRIVETLRYIEIATTANPSEPNTTHINVANGRLEWLSGTLQPHSPDIFETCQMPVSYDPHASCPCFDRYLQTTLSPDIIPLVEEVMGYCLIPDKQFEKAIMCVGKGGNGKSVLLDTITALLGEDNVSTVALQDLEENRFKGAELFGRLANICADLDYRALISSSVFKALVTGDRITAERKFGQPFSFSPYARLIFSTNSLPPTRDQTYAFYRRWIIIPFEKTFEGLEADKALRAKLRAELPGILNKALLGLRRLLSGQKFTEPETVRSAIAEYQRENDTVGSFARERIVSDINATIEKKILYCEYSSWCDANGLRSVTQKRFKSLLKFIFKGLDEVRSSGGRGPWRWVGIRLC